MTREDVDLTLALDTATEVSSAAVVTCGQAGGVVLAERSHRAAMGHVESMSDLIRHVLDQAGAAAPNRIVVGVGPGPFTGLRVGVVTALVLAEVWQVEVIGICSLDGIGAQVGDGVVITDARRKEVFAARYAHGRRVQGPLVVPRAEVQQVWPEEPRFGPAVDLCGGGQLLDVTATGLALAADTAARLPVRPWYLRAPDAKPQAG